MKNVALALSLIAVFVLAGCRASSHITLGPAKASSWVEAHEWRDGDFYAEDGKVGSTLGFFSSELQGEWKECEEISVGAGISWATEEDSE